MTLPDTCNQLESTGHGRSIRDVAVDTIRVHTSMRSFVAVSGYAIFEGDLVGCGVLNLDSSVLHAASISDADRPAKSSQSRSFGSFMRQDYLG